MEDGMGNQILHIFEGGTRYAGKHNAIDEELLVGIADKAKFEQLEHESARFGRNHTALDFVVNSKAGFRFCGIEKGCVCRREPRA